MNEQKIIGFSLIGLIALYFLRLKTTISHLNYYAAGVSLSWDNQTPVLKVSIGIQNPDENSFLVKSIVGNLYANGTIVGNVSAFTPLTVPPLSSVVYPVYVRLSILGITSNIIQILTGSGGFREMVEFDGTARVDNITNPLNIKYTIG